ncbi:hypothetical protein RD792_013578 [Penstemon davidsonii]|uniref:protein-serine/threonine phosphatase n=1 Tax=Penstemon davidsonii TaxID=160366 RepID=A0ABR0CW20_9LAMI|nr:hypothetical protein RD792_013578 [Penstemon davidsonii]
MVKEEEDDDDKMFLEFGSEKVPYESTPVHGGSVPGRQFLNRNHKTRHIQLMNDYFVERPLYSGETFRRRFRMKRPLFLRILADCERANIYFRQWYNAANRAGFSPILKVTIVMRSLAYAFSHDSNDENFRVAESTAAEIVHEFCKTILRLYQQEYLCAPTEADLVRLLNKSERRGFPGMIGSIDCMHWERKNCPIAWQRSFFGRKKKPTIVLEAVASHDTWIWHAFFGVPGAMNDVTVLGRSPLFDNLTTGNLPSVEYEVNGRKYYMPYYLVDGIYPKWGTLIQSVRNPRTLPEQRMAYRGLVKHYVNLHNNMIVEDERDEYKDDDSDDDDDDLSTSRRARAKIYPREGIDLENSIPRRQTLDNYIIRHDAIRSKEANRKLQQDLIAHVSRDDTPAPVYRNKAQAIKAKNFRRKRMELRRIRLLDEEKSSGDQSSSSDCDVCATKKKRYEKNEEEEKLIVAQSAIDAKNDVRILTRVRSHGKISVIGRRREMEDAVAVELGFLKKGNKTYDFFGVYDGHGGWRVAHACSEMLHKLLGKNLGEGNDCEEINWEKLMVEGFKEMDEEVNKIGAAVATTGSTAVVAVVGEEVVVVANCGDSRAVLSRGGASVQLSDDHKPDRPDELERIEVSGGKVINWNGQRVLGVLATSRSIGDHYLKPFVITEPEVKVINRTELDEFLILASDGLWDVVSNDLGCQIARRCLDGQIRKSSQSSTVQTDVGVNTNRSRASEAAAVLAELAMARGSRDNISVIVVDLRRSR